MQKNSQQNNHDSFFEMCCRWKFCKNEKVQIFHFSIPDIFYTFDSFVQNLQNEKVQLIHLKPHPFCRVVHLTKLDPTSIIRAVKELWGYKSRKLKNIHIYVSDGDGG